jgi:squalene-associated FAD-dependent desaturase
MKESEKPFAALQSESADHETLPLAELEPALSANVARSSKSVAIIGGGLAGMAAASVACQRGLQVDLFEQSDRLGGRAGSMEEPWNGQVIDQCQHVAMGCCGSFLDFCRRTGVEDCFQRHKTLHFIGPDGRQSDMRTESWLPAPFHLLPGLLRLKFLSLLERLSILRTLKKLMCLKISATNNLDTIGKWLREQSQSEKIIEQFWSVVITGALSETVDFASLAAAKKVFTDGFYASRHAYELITPRVPFDEIFDRRVSVWLKQRGVRIHRGARIMEIKTQDERGLGVFLYDGTVQKFHAVIVSVPWFEAPDLLSSSTVSVSLGLYALKQIPSAAITSVHLWFDQPITTLPHAALVGRLSQWIFNGTYLGIEHAHDKRGHGTGVRFHPNPLPTAGAAPGEGTEDKSYYYQVVISAAHRVIKHDKVDLLQIVLNDLGAVFPDARQAKLLHSRIVTMPRAVISLQPWVDRLRPSQKTDIPNLFLAGDWTATGWPGTMEGAVWSGYLAAEALLKYMGQ